MSLIEQKKGITGDNFYRASRDQLQLLALLLSVFLATSLYAQEGPPPAQVTVFQVKAVNAPVKIELPTILVGFEEAEIRPRVSGYVVSKNFKEGQEVQKGDSLFTLDVGTLAEAVARQKADLKALQARYDQAVRNLRRVNTLKNQRAIAQKDVDDAISAKAIAAADIAAGEARLKEVELDLEFADVKSPITGVTGSAKVSVGDYVRNGETLLVDITRTNPMYAKFNLPARTMSKVMAQVANNKIKLPEQQDWVARLRYPDGGFYAKTGNIDFIDSRVQPMTGSQEGRAIFKNSNNTLAAGQFLRIYVEGAYKPNVLTVPQKAVLSNAQGKFVYVYTQQDEGYVAQAQPVEVGEWVVINNENHWIIRSGLKQDMQVIDSGMARIFAPMSPVKAQPKSQESESQESESKESTAQSDQMLDGSI